MDIKRAIKLTKDLSEMFSGITEISDALLLLDNKDKVLTELKRHKDLLQKEIDKKKDEFSKISTKINKDIDSLKEKHATGVDNYEKDLKSLRQQKEIFQKELNIAKANATNAAKEEARSILEKARKEITSLNGQISLKSKTLQEMNEAIEKLKTKFG